jgi:hypothetical protein
MLKNYSTASESEYLCSLCFEPITNPICPDCLTKELVVWLKDYPRLSNRLLNRVRSKLKPSKENCECIFCHNSDYSICPYCFTEIVLEELEKEKVSKPIILEFLRYFNFDLENGGYSKKYL